MRSKRLGLPLAAVAALSLLAVEPAAAADSVTEELITGLNTKLIAIAVPVTVLVEGILLYTVWKFRKTDEPTPTEENRRLEVTWTVTTALVLLFVGFASYNVMASPYVAPSGSDVVQDPVEGEDPVVVDAVGVQWYWQFEYPDANVSSSETMVVPANETVVIRTKSPDVIHSFHAPELGLKADAVPGQTNYIRTRLTPEETPTTYRIYCAEFCGSGHSEMLGKVKVVSPEAYQEWLDEQQSDN